LRYVFLGLLAVQNSSSTLLRRYSKGVLKETYSSSSLLGVTEVMKFMVSFLMIEEPPDLGLSSTNSFSFRRRLLTARHAMRHSLPMVVPAVVYLVMNMLSFVAIERIDATSFSMVAQLKLLTTAMFSYCVLGRVLSLSQWRSICMITAGVMIITYERGSKGNLAVKKSASAGMENFSTSFMVGVLAVFVEISLSGWISTYFEKYLKDGTFSVWGRNFQLSVWSTLGYIVTYFLQTATSQKQPPDRISDPQAPTSFFTGWSSITWLVAFLLASGGLLVAFATKHADAVAKTIATALALVLVVVLEIILLGASADPIVALSSLIVLLAMEAYRESSRNSNPNPVTAATAIPQSSPPPSAQNGISISGESSKLTKSPG